VTTHYHLAVAQIVEGARIGYLPDDAPEPYSSRDRAIEAAMAAAAALAAEQRERGHEVAIRAAGDGAVTVEWEADYYSRARTFEPVECEVVDHV
jgi:hypothetical protein